MKRILFSIGCLSLVACGTIPVQEESPSPRLDGDKIFTPLTKTRAATFGAQLAKHDFQKGIYRILIYGFYVGPLPTEKRIFKRYGVYAYPIAACEVSEGITAGTASYNQEMRRLLNEKYGKDIFAECGF